MSIQQLFERTDAIADAMARLANAIATGAIAVAAAEAAQLAALVDALFEHERARIYDPLDALASTGPIDGPAFCSEMQALSRDWFSFAAEWTRDCISADLDAFAVETAQLMERLNTTLRRARTDLYPFALGTGLIRLRA